MRDQITGQIQTVTTNAVEANERMLDGIVEATKTAVKYAVDFADTAAERAPKFPVELPFADRLPTPAETGERYIDFVEKAVELNRDFSERLVAALPADIAPAKKASKKTATKTTAKKSTAKASAKK